MTLFGLVHYYERTCVVFQNQCKGLPTKGENGVDTYRNYNYTAPVHVVIGMAGFSLDKFPDQVNLYLLNNNCLYSYFPIFQLLYKKKTA